MHIKLLADTSIVPMLVAMYPVVFANEEEQKTANWGDF